MSEVQQPSGGNVEEARKIANINYILYVIGLVVGITSIVALVLAYINRSDAQGTWVESHFTWQIRTFWIGILYTAIGLVTVFIFIGIIVLILKAVWMIIRIVKGWSALNKNEPIPNPDTWLF